MAVGVASSVAVKQVQPIFATVIYVTKRSKEWKNSFKYNFIEIANMPRLMKIKGGYSVVHKITGKTIQRFTGKNAAAKAKKLVALGY